jgi:NADPH:quinone reductase-like Zn-dependent oxidoreductase
LPRGVRLTAYGGGSGDLPSDVLQRCLDRLAAGEVSLGPVRIYALEQIRQAHTDMEQNRTFGKMVVTTSP